MACTSQWVEVKNREWGGRIVWVTWDVEYSFRCTEFGMSVLQPSGDWLYENDSQEIEKFKDICSGAMKIWILIKKMGGDKLAQGVQVQGKEAS